MRRLIFFLAFILVVVDASAEMNIELMRDSYYNGETLQFMVSMKDRPYYEMKLSDFSFWDKYERRVPIGLFLNKFNDTTYYGYFDVSGLNNWDYTLKLDNYYYIKNGILIKGSNTSVIKIRATSPIVSIFPGSYIMDLNEGNKLILKLKSSETILVSISGGGNIPESSFYLNGEKYTDIKYTNQSYDNVIISYPGKSYNLPVKIIPKRFLNQSINQSNITLNQSYQNITANQTKFNYTNFSVVKTVNKTINQTRNQTLINLTNKSFIIIPKDAIRSIESKDIVDLVIDKNRSVSGSWKFQNFLSEPIYNVSFSLSENLKEIIRINNSFYPKVEPGEILVQYIWINERGNLSKNYEGELIFKSGEVFGRLPIKISLRTEEDINETKELLSNVTEFTEPVIIKPKEESKIWIYAVIIAIILILIWLVYYVYRKGNKPIKNELEEIVRDVGLK